MSRAKQYTVSGATSTRAWHVDDALREFVLSCTSKCKTHNDRKKIVENMSRIIASCNVGFEANKTSSGIVSWLLKSILGYDHVIPVPPRFPRATAVHFSSAYPQHWSVRQAVIGRTAHCAFVGRHGEYLFAEPCVAGAALCNLPLEWVGGAHFYAACVQLHRAAKAFHTCWPRARDFLCMDTKRMTNQMLLVGLKQEANPSAQLVTSPAEHTSSEIDDNASVMARGLWFNSGLSFVQSDDVQQLLSGPVENQPFSYCAQLSAAHRSLVCAAIGVESSNHGVAITAAVDFLSALCSVDVLDNDTSRSWREVSGSDVHPTVMNQICTWYLYGHHDVATSIQTRKKDESCPPVVDLHCDVMESTQHTQDVVRSACIQYMKGIAAKSIGKDEDPSKEDEMAARAQRYILDACKKYSNALTCDMQPPVILKPHVPHAVANIESIRDLRVRTVDNANMGVHCAAVSSKIQRARSVEEDTVCNLQWALTLAARAAVAMLHALPMMWCARSDFDEHSWNEEQLMFFAEEWRRAMIHTGNGYDYVDNIANPIDKVDPDRPFNVSERLTANSDAYLADRVTQCESDIESVMQNVYFVPQLTSILSACPAAQMNSLVSCSMINVREPNVSWDVAGSARDLMHLTYGWMKGAISSAKQTKDTCEKVAIAGSDVLMKHKIRDRFVETGVVEDCALEALEVKHYALSSIRGGFCKEVGAESDMQMAAAQTCAVPMVLTFSYYDTHSGLESTQDAAFRACQAVTSKMINASVVKTLCGNPAECLSGFSAHGVSRYVPGRVSHESSKSRSQLAYSAQTTKEMTASEFAVDVQTFCPPGSPPGSRTQATIGRCGAVKCAYLSIPHFLGSLIATNRVLKTSQRLNHVFSSAMISHAVDTAVGTHGRRRGHLVYMHAPEPKVESVILIANAQLVRSMPVIDEFVMDYLKAHTVCAMIRCCSRARVMPPKVSCKFGWFINLADALPAANSSKAALLSVISQLRYLANMVTSAVSPSDRARKRVERKKRRHANKYAPTQVLSEEENDHLEHFMGDNGAEQFLEFCKKTSAIHDEIDYDAQSNNKRLSVLISRLYHAHYLFLHKL